MTTYTFTKDELLHFAEMVYKEGYNQRVFDNIAGKIDTSDEDIAIGVEELLNFYTDWWGEDEDELDVPDDVDESNYDPYLGQDYFETDYNLGEAEEW